MPFSEIPGIGAAFHALKTNQSSISKTGSLRKGLMQLCGHAAEMLGDLVLMSMRDPHWTPGERFL